MDRKRILEEGLLEKYLLHELTVREQHAIEKVLQEDMDLKSRFEQLEADFEQMAFENAITPNSRVKESLRSRIRSENTKQNNNWPVFAAAGLAVLFLSTSFWLFMNWQDAQKDLEAIRNQTTDLQERMDLLEAKAASTETQLNLINDVHTIPFLLRGNAKLPNAQAVVFVNHADKLVMVNPKGLPELSGGQTYQMWSDVDGEMINMGLLSPNEELLAMEYINNAESLNITIEPAGGSEHPTVENLISNVML